MARDSKREFKLIITARNMTSRVMRSVRDGIRSIGRVSTVAAGVAAAAFVAVTGTIAGVVSKILDLNDDLAKQARRFKMTTEELSGLRHAAAMGGIEVKEIDTAIQYMERNASDAANGIGEAKDAFKALGISAEDLRKMNPADAFEMIVDRLQGVDNAMDRSSYAMDIFGRSGARVLTLTADGIRAARKEAEQFGIAINEADAKKMEDINDDFHKIKMALRGFATVFTTGLIKPIEKFTDKVSEAAKDGRLKLWATQTALVVVQGFQQILRVAGGASEVIIGFGRAFQTVYGTAIKIVGGLSAKVAENAETQLEKARKVLAQTPKDSALYDINRQNVERLERTAMESKALADASVAIVEKTEQSAQKLATLQGQITNGANRAAAELAGQVADLKKREGAIENQIAAQEKAAEGARKIGEATEEGVARAEAALDRLIRKYDELQKKQGFVSFSPSGKAKGSTFGDEQFLASLDKAVSDAERTQ